ncbi:MAG TPA: hypothetical protein PLD56_00590 [Chitinophagales bacterium]|nr:hypothetical protein [Chitinophagales bacterium]
MLNAARDIVSSYDDLIKIFYNKYRFAKNYHYRDILQIGRLWMIDARKDNIDRDYIYAILNYHFSKLYNDLFKLAISYQRIDDKQGLPSIQLIDYILDNRQDLSKKIEFCLAFKQTLSPLLDNLPSESKKKMQPFLSTLKNSNEINIINQEKTYPLFNSALFSDSLSY